MPCLGGKILDVGALPVRCTSASWGETIPRAGVRRHSSMRTRFFSFGFWRPVGQEAEEMCYPVASAL